MYVLSYLSLFLRRLELLQIDSGSLGLREHRVRLEELYSNGEVSCQLYGGRERIKLDQTDN